MRIKTWSGSVVSTTDYKDKEKILYRILIGWRRYAERLEKKNKKLIKLKGRKK